MATRKNLMRPVLRAPDVTAINNANGTSYTLQDLQPVIDVALPRLDTRKQQKDNVTVDIHSAYGQAVARHARLVIAEAPDSLIALYAQFLIDLYTEMQYENMEADYDAPPGHPDYVVPVR